MKKYIYTICLLLVYLITSAQQLKIKVVEKGTKKSVPYAVLSFIAYKVAYSADNQGVLKLDQIKAFNHIKNDSLYVSGFGYHTQKFPVSALESPIELEPKQLTQSNEKILRGKMETLNLVAIDSIDRYVGTELDSVDYLQLAQRFSLQKAGAVLEELILYQNVGKNNFIRVPPVYPVDPKEEDLSNTHFRLRFYGLDTLTGGPGEELGKEPIEVNGLFGESIKINLKTNNLAVRGKTFFVAVEWIRDKANNITLTGSFHRSNSKNIYYDKEKPNIRFIKYAPLIAMQPRYSIEQNTWMLGLNHGWKPYTYYAPEFTDLAITVKISYLK